MSHRMEFKAGFPHRTTQSEFSQYQTKLAGACVESQPASRIFEATAASLNRGNVLQKRQFGLVLGASESLDLAQPKMNEKELLHGLNDRFAGFIEKVRHLEHQNKLLEREIEDIRQKAQSSSSLAQRYEPELRDLRKLVNDITLQKRQIELEHQDLEEDVLTLRGKYDQEAHNRSDVENNIMVLKKDINDAYLAKLQLDKKAQSMVDEIHFLKKNHKVEVSGMLAQMQDTRLKVEAHDFGKPDITAALRDIRAQLEGHAVSDIQQAEECFRVQFAKLTKAAETNREALKATNQEIQEHRRRLQGKNIELDCAKGTREALTKQLNELEDRHNEELVHYQNTIRQLENELTNTKFDMSGHLREFQDLLNVKMALDVEIISYRQLLEGEESRLTISDTRISMPYIYRQSPVYTLPCLARQGGPTRRAEPQYKFVEEIITETTREVEMSEFEETGSEETVGGEGEDQRKREEHAKDEKGSSEEVDEEEDKEEDKAAFCEEAPEKEDEQVETSEEATEHGDGVASTPAEPEEGDEGKEETGDEPDAGDRKEDIVNPIQSEVNSVEATSDEEKYKLGKAENIDRDKKDAGEKLQKDGPSKQEDSQTPSEDTISTVPIRSEPEDSQKQSPLKESKEVDVKETITPLMEQKPEMDTTDMEEFKDSDQPTEPTSTVTVQEEALPVPSEETSTDKTSTEVTAEMKGTLTKEIGGSVKSSEDTKAPEIPGTTPEREMGPEEPNVSSKDESVKTTEEVTKDDSKDEKCIKESETSPKPDLTAIPKEEEIKESSSGDKAKTGAEESIVPEQQVTAVAESKESHSVAPESIKTQVKSEEEPEKVQVPKDLPNKTESAMTKESEVLTKCQKEATSEQVEISITKTSAVKEDLSAMGLKEKAVDEKKTEKEESKIENGFSEDGVSKAESKMKEQADPIKEKNAEPKTYI